MQDFQDANGKPATIRRFAAVDCCRVARRLSWFALHRRSSQTSRRTRFTRQHGHRAFTAQPHRGPDRPDRHHHGSPDPRLPCHEPVSRQLPRRPQRHHSPQPNMGRRTEHVGPGRHRCSGANRRRCGRDWPCRSTVHHTRRVAHRGSGVGGHHRRHVRWSTREPGSTSCRCVGSTAARW